MIYCISEAILGFTAGAKALHKTYTLHFIITIVTKFISS